MKLNRKAIIVVSVILLVVAGGALYLMHEEWQKDAFGGYGDLNMIEEGIDTNYSEYNLLSAQKKGYSYRISMDLIVVKGSVNVQYYLGDKLVYDEKNITKTTSIPVYQWEGNGDVLKIVIDPSDDVKGSFNFSVDQKTKKINRIIDAYFR